MRRQLPTIASALGAAGAIALGGCADAPTRPQNTTPVEESPARFAVSAEDRARLGAALGFAGEHAIRTLVRRAAAEQVATAFEALAERVEADDRDGALRAVAAVRTAIREYRELLVPNDAAALPDLEAMTLALDYAADAVRRESAPAPPFTTPSAEGRQP